MLVFSSGDIDKNEKNKNNETPAEFTGATTQARISATNAKDLTAGAVLGSLLSVAVQGSEFNQNSVEPQIDAFRLLRFPLILRDSLRRIEFSAPTFTLSEESIKMETGNFGGSCGGNFSYSLNHDTVAKKFSGNLSFANFCGNGITISGETDSEGTYDVDSGDFITANFSFDNLTDGYFTFDGEISIDFADQPMLVTLKVLTKNNRSDKIYWIKTYSMNIFEFVGHAEIEIYGTFYHPDWGFVDLTSIDPFIVHNEDDWPTSGRFVIEGDHHTKAELFALDPLIFKVEADADGDGALEWDSGFLNWTTGL